MKLRELLSEKISFTTARNDVADGIQTVIDELVENISNQFYTQFFEPGYTDYDQTYEFLKSNISRVLRRRLQVKLMSLGRKILELDPNAYFHIEFNDSNVGGAAYYDSIQINQQSVLKLAEKVLDKIIDSMLDNGAFNGDNIPKIEDVKYAAKCIRMTDIDIHDYKTSEIVNDLIGVFIHELVHIKQHSTQDKYKPTEYRSYATKDKTRFNKAIDNIHAGNASPEDMKLYRASPQEIPAFAHNAALEIIHSITDMNTDKITSIEDIKYYIEVLTDYIRGGRFATEYYRSHMPYYFNNFNNPGTKEYQVFKRFFKTVAQELMQYRDKLQQQLEKLVQRQKEDEAHYKWLNDLELEL
jgi:hypothetical protein